MQAITLTAPPHSLQVAMSSGFLLRAATAVIAFVRHGNAGGQPIMATHDDVPIEEDAPLYVVRAYGTLDLRCGRSIPKPIAEWHRMLSRAKVQGPNCGTMPLPMRASTR